MKAKRIFKKVISPIESFLKLESASGLLLMGVTAFTLVLANSPLYFLYQHIIELPIGLSFGENAFIKTFHHWVNDGLMVIFFFVVGLEIKRELIQGELSTPQKAILPMIAALGGMIFPATFYAFFNHSGPGASGWGIPMATDIAFAVGVLTLLGKRVPFSLKIFLLALAIADDLGAVLVIALFYTDHISLNFLGAAFGTFVLTHYFNRWGVKSFFVYTILGVIAWFTILKSGVHSTIAGVILGLMTPIQKVDHIVYGQISPLEHLLHSLHPWVSFVIMPIFAFTNAGVRIEGIAFSDLFREPVSLGIILGLFLGKPMGVFIFTYSAVKMGFAKLPDNFKLSHLISVGCLAGIGFTMALFVSHLALQSGQNLETFSKLGILLASVMSALVGFFFLFLSTKKS
jgi:NhaA family Na+:H+ antiporter